MISRPFVTAVLALTLSGPLFAAPETKSSDKNSQPSQEIQKPNGAAYTAKDYSKLIGMKGFSDKLLNNHFKLYQGYVKNSNLLNEQLSKMMSEGQSSAPAFAELRRRFGWEFNGMRLHEYYFENLGGKDSLESGHPLAALIQRDFGGLENWKKEFVATGAMRGIGWVVLYYDAQANRLFNTWINEHDLGHLAGAQPLLVMDVFEHAYMTDYELDKAAYIQSFMNNINWAVVKSRWPGESKPKS